MKKLKAIAITVLSLAVLTLGLLSLAGCGNTPTEQNIEGTWLITKNEVDGVDKLDELNKIGAIAVVQFDNEQATEIVEKLDGSKERTSLGTYEVNGSDITMGTSGHRYTGKISNDTITFDVTIEGVHHYMQFVKQ